MDNAVIMHVVNSLAHLLNPLLHFRLWDFAMLFDLGVKVATHACLHHQVGALFIHAVVVQFNYVWMVEK